MIFKTALLLIAIFYLLILEAYAQNAANPWPKNIRENFEERTKQENYYYKVSQDKLLRSLILHPEEKEKIKEKAARKAGEAPDQKEAVKKEAGNDTADISVKKAKEKSKRKLSDPVKRLGGVLKVSDILTFSPLMKQINQTELIFSAAALTYLYQNDRPIFQSLDRQMNNSPFWQKNGNTINALGDGLTAIGLYGVLAVAGGEKNLTAAQVGFESFIYTGLQCIALKQIIGKSRPSEKYEQLWPISGNDSMPSGHMATAVSMATVLDRMYKIGWLTYPLAMLNGFARIQANTHWMSDILVGGLLGHLGANEIMARHGIIKKDNLKRRKTWENTFVTVDSYLEDGVDTCANFSENNPRQDNVGMLATNYSISHCLSPNAVIQFSSRFLKKTFNTFSWNNVEDSQVYLRYAHKVMQKGILYCESSITNINYIDIQLSQFNSAPGHFITDPQNYLQNNQVNAVEGGLIWEFSPQVNGKIAYNGYNDSYSPYVCLGGYGYLWRGELGGEFGRKKDFNLRVAYTNGKYITSSSQYSYNIDGMTVQVGKSFSDSCNLNFLYGKEDRKYISSAYLGVAPGRDRWSVTGLELKKDFQSDWTGSLSFYRKTLTSPNPGWSYKKNVFSVNITSRF